MVWRIKRLHIIAAVISILLLVSSCRHRDIPTIWKQELPSPDGKWVAVAHTEQDGGFGSAWIGTEVSLKRMDGTVRRGEPFNILEFDCPGPAAKPYELSDANAGGTINLKMTWLDPQHLDVYYDGKATVNLQVVKFADVEIRLHSGAEPKS
jgi:hypothetical protein